MGAFTKKLARLFKPAPAPAALLAAAALPSPQASSSSLSSNPSSSRQPSAASSSQQSAAGPPLDDATAPLLRAFLDSEDAAAAAAAAEGLFAAASKRRDLPAQLAAHRELLYRLRQLLRDGGAAAGGSSDGGGDDNDDGGSSRASKLQAYAAYLVSALAGASPAADAALVDNGLVGCLVGLLASSRCGATKKGTLRALSKLLGCPEAADQLAQCGGLTAVTALLDSDDTGIVRRCLGILSAVCSSPDAGAAAGAELLAAGSLGSLARLAECRSAEVQAEAAEVLKLLARLPEAGPGLLEVGGIEALVHVADSGLSKEGQAAARVALQRLGEAAAGAPGVRSVLRVLQAAGHWHGAVPQPHPKPAGRSPFGTLSPPGSASGPGQHLRRPTGSPGLVFSTESAVHLLPSGGSGSAAGANSALARQFVACQLASAVSGSSGVSASEARDQFAADAAPASLLMTTVGCGGEASWHIRRSDIAICRDERGREVKLGEGGFGTVLKGVMNGVDEVAVKRALAASPSAADLALFTKEVTVLRSLHHRNIVQFYGACLEPGSLFFVTELMRGGDLYSLLRRQPGAVAWGRMGRKLALDVALGLNHLHTRRPPLLHRDLKSPNVLISEEGVAKLADVGMARSAASDLVTAQPVLTPLWAAPEVLRRERTSLKADIWSFGVVLWEILNSTVDITTCTPLAYTRQAQAQQAQQAERPQLQQAAAASVGEPAATAPPDCGAPQLPAALPAGLPAGAAMELPPGCPRMAAHVFRQCTQLDPALRPSAAQIVEWLRTDCGE